MTFEHPAEVICPKCGTEQDTKVWSAINVRNDPSLRDLLFKGEINQVICKKCQEKSFLYEPLMYHDPELKFAVQYYPPQYLDDPEFIGMFEPGNPPSMPRLDYMLEPENLPKERNIEEEAGYLLKPHIVFFMEDLCCCIVFHERIREK